MTSIQTIVDTLAKYEAAALTIVAIDGGGGSGKTTIAHQLEQSSLAVQVIHMDDFYQTRANLVVSDGDKKVNFDWQRLFTDVLQPLRRQQSGSYHPLIWQEDRHATEPTVVQPAGIVVVEGVMSLRRELRPFYDLKIWVESPEAIRLKRGLERDGMEARQLWVERWLPAEKLYKTAHAPHEAADMIIHSG